MMAPGVDIMRDIVATLLHGILSVFMIHRFYCTNEQANTMKQMTMAALTFTIMSCIIFISDLIEKLTAMIQLFTIFFVASDIAITAVYILTLMRLYYSFKESTFEISKWTIYGHIVCLIIQQIIWIILTLLSFTFSDGYFGRYDRITGALGICVYCIGYSHLVYKFNYNLFQLVLIQRSTIINYSGHNDADTDQELNIRQKQLIQAIVKQTLLHFGIVCMFAIKAISFVVIAVVDPTENDRWIYVYEQWMIAMVYCSIGIMASLTFSVNAGLYDKICSTCHKKCDTLCQARAAKSMSGQIQDLFMAMN